MEDTLENRVALVTGASRGIGKAIALALADEGIAVGVNYLRKKEQAKEVCRILKEKGVKATSIQADVSEAAEVKLLIEQIEKELGSITILINNAGIGQHKTLDEITEQDFDETIKANLKSTFLVTQAVLPAMRRIKWGRIINISSLAGQTGGGVGLHYAASKAGQIGLMHYYSKALAAEGITVKAVSPALIETDMLQQVAGITSESIPVKRFGTVEEVAEVVKTLLRNSYITNQTIHVNGGLYPTS